MIRKLKALGLALLAVAAVSGAAAAGAQANSEIHIRSENDSIITSDENLVQHVLRVGQLGEVKCQTAEFTVRVPGSHDLSGQTRVQHLIVTADYGHKGGSCTAFGGAAQVQMNGCRYTLQSTATAGRSTATVVGCTVGKQITVTTGLCQLHIGEQAALEHVVAQSRTNAPRLHDIDVNATVSGIVVQKRGVCPEGAASFSGETTVQAYNDLGNPVQETVTEHQFTHEQCGAEVGIMAT